MPRSKHHTGWAGALGVASELSRRGHDAAITLGNTPALDLICSSPEGTRFTIQVKTASTKTWVPISKVALDRDAQDDLFYVVAFIPADLSLPFEYYILSSAEVHEAWLGQRKVKLNGQPYKPGFEGLGWGDVKTHLGRWDKLPS